MVSRLLRVVVVSGLAAGYLTASPTRSSLQLTADASSLQIHTFAGDGSNGYSGDGGPATSAELGANSINSGIASDDNGDIAIADSGNKRRTLRAGWHR